MISAKLTGDRRLMAQLNAIAATATGQMLRPAGVAGALLVSNDAKTRSPYLTGNNRRGIHVGGEGSTGGLEGGTTGTDIGGQEIGATTVLIPVGTNVAYARRLELGFAGADSLGRTFNQPAQPYLRPAIEAQHGAVVNEVGAAFVDLVRAAAR